MGNTPAAIVSTPHHRFGGASAITTPYPRRKSSTSWAKASGISSTSATEPPVIGAIRLPGMCRATTSPCGDANGSSVPHVTSVGTADLADLLLHLVAAAGAVALPDLLAGPERVGQEACQQIGPVLRVEALPDLPELGDVAAVRLRLDVVDAMPARAVAPVAVGPVHEGAGREDQPLDAIRMGRRQLHRDHGARVVTDGGERPDAEPVDQRDGAAGVVLDVAAPVRLVRLAVADRVHGDHPPLPRQDGNHLAILVPRAGRLVKQEDGPAGARGHVVDLPLRRVQEPSVHRALLVSAGTAKPGIAHDSPDRARRGLSTVIRW